MQRLKQKVLTLESLILCMKEVLDLLAGSSVRVVPEIILCTVEVLVLQSLKEVDAYFDLLLLCRLLPRPRVELSS